VGRQRYRYLLAGQALEYYRDFHLVWGALHLNAYTLLFLGGGVVSLGSLGVLDRIQAQPGVLVRGG
jgi:hypothetical protein